MCDRQFGWGERKQMNEGVFSEVNRLPDNRLVLYTPAKDGTKKLLADPSVVIDKPVDRIAVSYNDFAL